MAQLTRALTSEQYWHIDDDVASMVVRVSVEVVNEFLPQNVLQIERYNGRQ